VGRLRRGWELTGKSWRLLRSNKQLLRFPVYGGLAALLPLALLVAPGLYFIDTHDTALGVVLLVPGAYLAVFATIFFSVGLAATADEIFHGREASVGRVWPSHAAACRRSPAGPPSARPSAWP
jgi:hypothetical protein